MEMSVDDLRMQHDQSQLLIAQLKDMVRERDESVCAKEKELEVNYTLWDKISSSESSVSLISESSVGLRTIYLVHLIIYFLHIYPG